MESLSYQGMLSEQRELGRGLVTGLHDGEHIAAVVEPSCSLFALTWFSVLRLGLLMVSRNSLCFPLGSLFDLKILLPQPQVVESQVYTATPGLASPLKGCWVEEEAQL